jgi:hypothetical protein
MSDGDIDFSKYTRRELEEALRGINRHRYPKNYANLRGACERLTSTALPEPQADPAAATYPPLEDPPQPKYDESGRYVPNQIPSSERAHYILFSLLLFAYGTFGVWINDLYVPAKRRGMHLHDSPAWVMYGAILCACLVMLSVVVDHYDRRDNETGYRFFADFFKFIGWMLFGLSVLFNLMRR